MNKIVDIKGKKKCEHCGEFLEENDTKNPSFFKVKTVYEEFCFDTMLKKFIKTNEHTIKKIICGKCRNEIQNLKIFYC